MPNRKSVDQAEEAKVNKPEETNGGAPNSPVSPMAELARDRGITIADLRSAYRSSLAVPDIKTKCDALLLLTDLYLFTYPDRSEHGKKKTAADAIKNSYRVLKQELDKLIPRYGTLLKNTSELCSDPKLKILNILINDLNEILNEPMALLKTAQKELQLVRDWAGQMGSLKTKAKHFYLYSMATRLHKSTGKYYYGELTTLTDAALAAHGGTDNDALDQKTLEREVQRYINRMNLRSRARDKTNL